MVLIVNNFTENIEQEDAHIFMQILMIEKEFRQES